MKRFFLVVLMIVPTMLFAEMKSIFPDANFFRKDIPIIDIRTKPEWVQTGIVKGAKTITFFDERGQYNAQAFLNELDKVIDKSKPFGIICRTGRRTGLITPFLDKEGYRVINLKGGITHLPKINVPLVPYR